MTERSTVLVVNDDPINRRLLERSLTQRRGAHGAARSEWVNQGGRRCI